MGLHHFGLWSMISMFAEKVRSDHAFAPANTAARRGGTDILAGLVRGPAGRRT